MARKPLTAEDKQARVNEFLQGKEQSVVAKFNTRESLDEKYKYMTFLIRTSTPKKSSVEESSVDTVISNLTSVLRKKLSTDELSKLKDGLNNAITTIDTKIKANKKSDDIIKVKEAIKAMEEAGFDITDAKAKLEELMK